MLIPVAVWWVLTLAQSVVPVPAPPPATFVGAAEIDATLRASIANNTLDTRVALAPGTRGIVRVGIVHRSTQEPRALMHDELTEIYQIVEGSGTLVTGGAMTDCAPVADPPNRPAITRPHDDLDGDRHAHHQAGVAQGHGQFARARAACKDAR